jgi:hypothetical protein
MRSSSLAEGEKPLIRLRRLRVFGLDPRISLRVADGRVWAWSGPGHDVKDQKMRVTPVHDGVSIAVLRKKSTVMPMLCRDRLQRLIHCEYRPGFGAAAA